MVVWGEKDTAVRENGWDIWGRTFSDSATGGTVQRLNTRQFGDEYAPKVAALEGSYLAVWTSLGQDGSWEGVYGQFVNGDGNLVGGEFRLNTTVISRQINPVVTSDGDSRFLGFWSSFVGGINSYDLFAQRYVVDSQPLAAPGAPFVTALSSAKLSVTWPEVGGLNVTNYELYVDGSSTPTLLTSNLWVNAESYAPNSTHSFRLAYVLADGRKSPQSDVASGTTWGNDENFDGLPDDWQALYWGSNGAAWPAPNEDSDGDGASNRDEFLAGTDPTSKDSVLSQTLEATSQGLFLKWNTRPGSMYQVQTSGSMGGWTNLGGPRFAAGTTDSMNAGVADSGAYYRIIRLR